MKTIATWIASASTGIVLLATGCADSNPGGTTGRSHDALAEQRVWTRMSTPAPGKLRGLLQREGVDVTGSSHRLGYVDVLTSKVDRDRLVAKYADRIQSARALDMGRPAEALSDYQNPAEVSAFLDQVEATYPAIAQKVTLQAGLPEGGVIYAMKISDNVAMDEDEPTYLMDGQIHAREVMTAEIMTDAIDYLTSNYGSDPQVTRWVDEMEIWIVPVVNPDGASWVFTSDNWWRKNRSDDCGGEIGVDLNRNFAWNYRQCPGSDNECWSDVYHGPSAASEPETQTIQNLQAELRPLYYINYHSYGEYIIWPSACGTVDEDALLRQVGEELQAVVADDSGQTGNYTIGTAIDTVNYTAPGGAEDHAYGAYGIIGLTFEVNSGGFQPDYATYRDATVQRQRAGWGLLLDRTLDGPAVTGHTFDADSGAPVVADWIFANHPFGSGQWQLTTDANGRYNRVVEANSEQVLVFSAPGYLPETRVIQVGTGPVDTPVPMTAGVNHAPSADAGPDQTVSEGDTVILDASASTDPDGNALLFTWTQTAGPAVNLEQAWTAQPTFFAPAVAADTPVTFELTASDGELTSAPDQVTVTIRNMWDDAVGYDSPDTPIDIPDNTPNGISSIIHVVEDRPILAASVQVDITHTWIGDLRISLTSPAGTEVELKAFGDGGSDHDIHATYEPPEFIGQLSGGDWVLYVEDGGPSDLGTLDHWGLTLELVGEPGCQSAGDCDLPNVGQHDCVDGRCEIAACQAGFADCNGTAGDGCEVGTADDLANCGACGEACSFDHAAADCQAGACVMGACDAAWQDCNADPADGCEIDTTSDPTNCGGCAQACDLANASATCQASTCSIAACDALWDDCDGLAANGCEADVSVDPDNCGACANTCDLPHAESTCAAGDCQVTACQGTWQDCDGLPANGCERDLDTDVEHCGACDLSCHALNAQVSCQAGACVMGDCLDGFGDCNQQSGDGCEAQLASDPDNCGACDVACDLAHAVGQCLAGACQIEACDEGFGDCNADDGDGCEADLVGDPANCGACGQACALPHAEPGCQAANCVIAACDVAFGDCNADPADGCETYLNNDDANCGDCDSICDLPNASQTCRQGECALTACDEGFDNCNRDSADGCEVNILTDVDNCGDCGQACEFPAAEATCQAGSCVLAACMMGFGDCNADPADGCEADLQSDAANCGACGDACAQGQVCNAGTCGEPCADGDDDGYADSACGGQDCDDTDAQINPAGVETCNGADDDCDGQVDEELECDQGGCGCASSGRGSAGGWLIGLLLLAGRVRRRRSGHR